MHELGLAKVRAPSGRLVYAPPGSNDLLALVRRRALKTEGNLQIFMANLRYFKEALAKLRAGASA